MLSYEELHAHKWEHCAEKDRFEFDLLSFVTVCAGEDCAVICIATKESSYIHAWDNKVW